ncbi:MAG: metalloregulator ArsR/SmtB family transcription factor [Fimbriimonadaceae bacterium]|nr:metalloregulator ArsR/SmtB family transcription factor [Alphaproteobacteria bacterium]
MVEYQEQALDATFSALADPTRRAILARLATGDMTVGELAAPFDMSLAAVSKHLRVLAKAELVSQHKEGRARRCRLEPQAMKAAARWIEFYKQFWNEKFDSLERYVQDLDDEKVGVQAANRKEEP